MKSGREREGDPLMHYSVRYEVIFQPYQERLEEDDKNGIEQDWSMYLEEVNQVEME